MGQGSNLNGLLGITQNISHLWKPKTEQVVVWRSDSPFSTLFTERIVVEQRTRARLGDQYEADATSEVFLQISAKTDCQVSVESGDFLLGPSLSRSMVAFSSASPRQNPLLGKFVRNAKYRESKCRCS